MKIFSRLLLIILPIFFASCSDKGGVVEYNPLSEEWSSPYGLPPFAEIEAEHFAPALEAAMAEHSAEVEAIASSTESASYQNTSLALELSGTRLADLSRTLKLLAENMGGDYVEVAHEWLPRVEAHYTRVAQNQSLFIRITALYRSRTTLDSLEGRVVERVYRNALQSGALLEDDERERVVAIDSLLMLRSLEYAETVVKSEEEYHMLLKSEQLSGIPVGERNLAKSIGVELGYEDRWYYTTHPESADILLSTVDYDTIRTQLYDAYISKGITPEADNRKVSAEMIALRAERAELIGYSDYRTMVADGNRSGDGRRLDRLADSLYGELANIIEKPLGRIRKVHERKGAGRPFTAADMLYYQEQVRDEYAALSLTDIYSYLPLSNVRTGVFWLANRLYGLTFTPLSEGSYSSDVSTYSVADYDGRSLGVLIFDPYIRSGKLSGMRTYEVIAPDTLADGTRRGSVVAVVASFRRTDSQPVLLTPEQSRELFGEMGIAIAKLLQRSDLPSLRQWDNDYAALAEKVMEQWALQPQLMRNYALHYSSGLLLENNVIRKIDVADTLDRQLNMVRQLNMAKCDKELHSSATADVTTAAATAEGLMPLYGEGALLPLFANGSPEAGRYGDRLWGEVVAADIFYTFKQSGDIFDRATALRLRALLERGGEWSADELYREFSEEGVNHLPWMVSVGLADESVLLPPSEEEEEEEETKPKRNIFRPSREGAHRFESIEPIVL